MHPLWHSDNILLVFAESKWWIVQNCAAINNQAVAAQSCDSFMHLMMTFRYLVSSVINYAKVLCILFYHDKPVLLMLTLELFIKYWFDFISRVSVAFSSPVPLRRYTLRMLCIWYTKTHGFMWNTQWHTHTHTYQLGHTKKW